MTSLKDRKYINRMSRPIHTGKFADILIKPQQELLKFVSEEDSGI